MSTTKRIPAWLKDISPPFFQFFPDDWLGSNTILVMNCEEELCFFRLVLRCWTYKYCALPGNDADLLALSGLNEEQWSRCKTKVLANFMEHPYVEKALTHKRHLAQRKEFYLARKKKKIAGKKGAQKRWEGAKNDSRKCEKNNKENTEETLNPLDKSCSGSKMGDGTAIVLPSKKGQKSIAKNSPAPAPSPTPAVKDIKDKRGAPLPNSRKKKNWPDGKPLRPDNPVRRILWFAKKASLAIRGAPLIPRYEQDGKNIKTLLAEPEVSEKLVLVALVAFFSDSRHRWLNEEVADRDIRVFISMATYCLGEGLKILQRTLARTKPEPPPPKASQPLNPALEKLWVDCKKKIKDQILPESYSTWFEPTYARSLENGSLTVAVPNQFYRKCLIENYRDLIENTLHGIRDGPLLVDFCIEADRVQLDTG